MNIASGMGVPNSIIRGVLDSAVASQAGQQPRIPPLRPIVEDSDAQSLLLPDHHDQLLAPRDACVDQVALKQHVCCVASGITTAGNSDPCNL
jgi:hypothetical protein